jgi:Ribonucleases G and E
VGGLVVMESKDMTDEENQNKGEAAVRKAVHPDRARDQYTGISRIGLPEVSRQRIRPSQNESQEIEQGAVRGPRARGQSIPRIGGEEAAKDNTGEIQG